MERQRLPRPKKADIAAARRDLKKARFLAHESVEVSVAVLLRRQGFKLPWAARSKSSVLAATASYDTSCARLVGERAANFETADRDAGEASRVVATVTTEQAN